MAEDQETIKLRAKYEKSQQQVLLLKAVLEILRDDLEIKDDHNSLFSNLRYNPVWAELEASDFEEEVVPQAKLEEKRLAEKQPVKPYFSILPQDVCLKLTGWLSYGDVCSLACVSSQFRDLCKNELVWKFQYQCRWTQDVNYFDDRPDEKMSWGRQFRERVCVETNWAQGKSKVISLPGHKGSVTALQYDNQHLLTASDDGCIIKWGLDRMRETQDDGSVLGQHQQLADGMPYQKMKFHGHSGPIWCLNFQGNLLASGSYDKTVKIWKVNSGNCLLTLRGHVEWVSTVCLNGLLCMSGSWDASFRIWRISHDFKSAQTLRVVRGDPGNAVYSVKWNPHARNQVAVACRNNAIQLWDIEQGQIVSTLMGHTKEVQCMQVGQNTIVSGSGDHTVKLWDQRTKFCVHTFRGHTGSVMTLQHDNMKIVSGGYDKALRIFDIRGRKMLHSLFGHSSAVFAVQFDSERIVSGSADTRAIVWQFR